MIKVVCADGRVLEEFIDRDWLQTQVSCGESSQITTPSGRLVQFSHEEAVRLQESCRKMTSIPQPRRADNRSDGTDG